MAKHKKLTKAKARKILKDGTVRGHALTKKQRGYFGIIAGGGKPRSKKRKTSRKRSRRRR